MTPAERRTRRESLRAARHAKWGGPRPPWIRDLSAELAKLAPVVRKALLALARDAVRAAAQSALAGGRDKHDAAVERVVGGSGIAADLAGEVVWRAFEGLADKGEL